MDNTPLGWSENRISEKNPLVWIIIFPINIVIKTAILKYLSIFRQTYV